MKTCTGCHEVKPFEEFYPRNDRKQVGKYSAQCKSCLRLVARRQAERDREKRKPYFEQYRRALGARRSGRQRSWGTVGAGRRAFLSALKANPCMDCGGRFPVECMDFDHVVGDKLFNIAHVITRAIPDDVLMDELMKCEIVCSNCHRIRSARRARKDQR